MNVILLGFDFAVIDNLEFEQGQVWKESARAHNEVWILVLCMHMVMELEAWRICQPRGHTSSEPLKSREEKGDGGAIA